MSDVDVPTLSAPFTYVLLPCDNAEPPSLRRFDGATEEALKAELTSHFSQRSLTTGQRGDLVREMTSRCQGEAVQPDMMSALQNYADSPSYEIVPVVMPTTNTAYVGTSLYIDDAGRFKDLPLNDRASRIAQRDIRGDAFVLRNHDDPALDTWERVDCTVADVEALVHNPPGSLDTANKAAVSAASAEREAASRVVTDADAAAATEEKTKGNDAFTRGALEEACELYSSAANRLLGRLDLRPHDGAALSDLRRTCLVNLSLAEYQRRAYERSANAARAAVAMDATHPKALFRLSAALIGAEEWDAAREVIGRFAAAGGTADDVAGLEASLADAQRASNERQRTLFSRLFAS